MTDAADKQVALASTAGRAGSTYNRQDIGCAAAIIAAVLIVSVPGITAGGLGWSDAPNHTFDGIFILEYAKACLADHSLLLDGNAARRWAEEFYIKYPALGIVVYWPPGFAAVEALIFAVFGVSIVTARATVILFAVAAGWTMFSLGKRWFDRRTGVPAAILLVTCPHGARWLNDVMLEWPATFWILLTAWAYQKDRDTRQTRWPLLLAGALVMAFLTKQTAAFIGPVLLLHALLATDRRAYLLRPAFIASLLLAGVVVAGYLLLTAHLSALPPQLLAPSLDAWYYPRHLPEILGWPLLVLALAGLARFIAAPDRSARGLLLVWTGAWLLFCSVISAKEPRYFFFALPPLVLAAVRLVADSIPARRPATQSWPPGKLRPGLLIALAAGQVAWFHAANTGRLPAYAGAVAELAARPDADLVLVDAVRDGQFVFDVYGHQAARGRIIPLRASKLLYARAARMQYAGQILAHSDQDIIDLLNRYGIRYVVVESALPRTPYTAADPPPRKLLRDLLANDPRFILVKSWPLRCGDPAWDDVDLRLYAYPTCPPRQSPTITMPFPAMGRDIIFPVAPASNRCGTG